MEERIGKGINGNFFISQIKYLNYFLSKIAKEHDYYEKYKKHTIVDYFFKLFTVIWNIYYTDPVVYFISKRILFLG